MWFHALHAFYFLNCLTDLTFAITLLTSLLCVPHESCMMQPSSWIVYIIHSTKMCWAPPMSQALFCALEVQQETKQKQTALPPWNFLSSETITRLSTLSQGLTVSQETLTGSGPARNNNAVTANVSESLACVSCIILATAQCQEVVILQIGKQAHRHSVTCLHPVTSNNRAWILNQSVFWLVFNCYATLPPRVVWSKCLGKK